MGNVLNEIDPKNYFVFSSDIDDRLKLSRRLSTPQNPFPEWAQRQQTSPHLEPSTDSDSPAEWVCSVYDWDGVIACLQHPAVKVAEVHRRELRRVVGKSIHSMDPPEHTSKRRMLQDPFDKTLDALDRDRMIERARKTIDRFRDQERANLVQDFAFGFPVGIVADLLGLPESHVDPLRKQIRQFAVAYRLHQQRDGEEALLFKKRDELREYFQRILEIRRRNARNDDLISRIVHHPMGGDSVPDREITSFLILFTSAATTATAMSLSMLLYALLTHSRQERLLRADLSRTSDAVQEGLRWAPPFTVVERRIEQPIEVADEEIPGNTRLMLYLGAANRDPAKFDRPHQFDITRSTPSHLSFAAGPHVCLGRELAVQELQVGLRIFFESFEHVEIAPDKREETRILGRFWRGLTDLPVILKPGC